MRLEGVVSFLAFFSAFDMSVSNFDGSFEHDKEGAVKMRGKVASFSVAKKRSPPHQPSSLPEAADPFVRKRTMPPPPGRSTRETAPEVRVGQPILVSECG